MYVLDDEVVSTGSEFRFASIDEVAETCLSTALNIISEHGKRTSVAPSAPGNDVSPEDITIILGGWSYGGVVSYELAKRLMASNQIAQKRGFRVVIESLLLFDAPFHDSLSSSDNHEFPFANSNSIEEGTLESKASVHFAACTILLHKYRATRQIQLQHGELPTTTTLSCPIYFFNPQEGENKSIESTLHEKLQTKSTIRILMVPGNHWSMLFGNNAKDIAGEILKLLP
jgi:surfactin synthase thioesterase subunit